MNKIEIERQPNGVITIRRGERYEDRLGPDEALWAVARFLLGHDLNLRTQAEHDAWNEKYGTKETVLESWQKILPISAQMGIL